MPVSKEKFYMSGRDIRKHGQLNIKPDQKWTYSELDQIGFGGLAAMDSALTGPAMSGGFIQREMLQHVLPGLIRTATRVRVLDEITGVLNAGNWHDEEIILNVATPAGKAELYGDHTNIPLASYGQDQECRGIVRFELGFQVGKLEEARQSAAGFETAAEKRNAVAEALEQGRERIGYYGFNSPDTRVFGMLNEPNLPAYETAAAKWKGGTFAAITGDITAMFSRLEMQSGGIIKDDTAITVTLPLGYRSALNVANPVARGETVYQWVKENYPNLRFVFSPEFAGANGGADVVYMFAETVDDDSTATSAVLLQVVPVKYQLLGSENKAKGYLEDATNATAGIIVTRPWAVTRLTGI
ncbi:major capsid family protein [Morganella morganii]|uniref:major capsid family protein n=1 Tax=Morganella morganii TaxID=582 RepID=UPI003EBE459A